MKSQVGEVKNGSENYRTIVLYCIRCHRGEGGLMHLFRLYIKEKIYRATCNPKVIAALTEDYKVFKFMLL